MAASEMKNYFWLSDISGRFLQVDDDLCALLGYLPAEMLSLSVNDIDYAVRLPQTDKILKNRTRYRRKDGLFLEVEVCSKYQETPSGGQFFSLLVVQEKAEPSESQLQMILNAQNSNIILFNAESEVLWTNKTTRESCATEPGQLLGKKCNELWPLCDSRVCEVCPVNKARETGLVHEKKMSMLEGRRWRVTGIPVQGDDGNVDYIVMVGNDITEYLTIAREVRQSHKLESLGTLAGGIAHDFNNILSGIMGYTELSLTMLSKEDAQVKDYLYELLRACKRATELVRQILTFSRQGEGKSQVSELPVIVKEVLKLLRSTLPTTIELKKNIDNDVNPVLADPVQIHQIIMNLCTNASHAMEPYGGLLVVTIKNKQLDADFFEQNRELVPGEYLELSISDSGAGMSPEVITSIFDPYFTTKKKGQGTGLGLSVVHGIVKDCGGHISVESELGKGAKFSILLPTVERARAIEEMIEVGGVLHGTESILIVDDEPVVLKVTKKYLEIHGYKVTTQTNSQHALDMIRENPDAFDLLISDVTMPHLTGDRLAREVLAIRKNLPVILITGYSDFITERSVKQDGIKALVMKPLVGNAFLSQIRQVLDEEKNDS